MGLARNTDPEGLNCFAPAQGAPCSPETGQSVFFFSDPMMGILALVNLLTIIMLFPVGMRVLHDYRDQLKQGADEPVFDPAKFPDLDIDASAWEK